jgi:diguanylate cyclase (GGDEF)-like protein/PAS domain S-box-containing protein
MCIADRAATSTTTLEVGVRAVEQDQGRVGHRLLMVGRLRRFLPRPRIWHKLAVIGLAFMVPLAASSFFLAMENGRRIEFSQNELRGLEYLRPVSALLVDLDRHRTLNRQVLAGLRPYAELAGVEARVHADLADLLTVDRRLGRDLRTTAGDLDAATTAAGLTAGWRLLRTAEPDVTSSEAGHAALSASVRKLIAYVGVTSNLTLDPELETYYAGDALVVQAPELIDRVRRLADSVDNLVGQRVTLADRNRVAAAVALLDVRVDALHADLFTVFRNGPDRQRSGAFQAAVDPLLQSAYASVTGLRTLVVDGVGRAPTLALDHSAYVGAVDAATDAMTALWTGLQHQERQLLRLRLADDQRQRGLGIAVVLAALTCAALVTVWLSRRIAGGVGSVARVATELAGGDLTRRVAGRSRDEIGALAVAFNSMATQLQENIEELRQAQERFRLAFDNAPIGMCLVGPGGRFMQVNQALCDMLGYRGRDLLELGVLDITHPDDAALSKEAIADLGAGRVTRFHAEKRYLHADGHVLWGLLSAAVMHSANGGPGYVVAQVQDTTERHAAEERLVHQATHDPLTGLPNRVLLMDRLEMALARGRHDPTSCVAVLFVDVDGFKAVNDCLGHDVADDVLVEIAGRLRRNVRPLDTVARLGGDEFVIVCQDLVCGGGPEGVLEIGERLVSALADPIMIGSTEVPVTASIGIAYAAAAEAAAEGLIRDADRAMYRAKARGKNRYELFDETLRARSTDRIAVERALHRGLRNDRFRLFFQPVVDVRTVEPVAVEALVRLDDTEQGLMTPDRFIEAAEETGLIVPIGAWAVTDACRQLASWQAAATAPADLHVAVNLSVRQASRPDLVDTVVLALVEAGLPPHALALELTESVLIDGDAMAMRQLGQLRDMGVRLGIDDFGTGYASLTYLKRLPINFVKIDRSFVSGMVNDPSDRKIVAAVIRLAQTLGLVTIAEGVEEPAQLALLRALGCNQAQGYLFGRPEPGPPGSGDRQHAVLAALGRSPSSPLVDGCP